MYHTTCMREWLSGGAPPCQGGGRGFDPRLALSVKRHPIQDVFFVIKKCQSLSEPCYFSVIQFLLIFAYFN